MMSAPFYKVSILTFSPCGGFFPHPTTDCETATTGNERETKTLGRNHSGLAAGAGGGRAEGAETDRR